MHKIILDSFVYNIFKLIIQEQKITLINSSMLILFTLLLKIIIN